VIGRAGNEVKGNLFFRNLKAVVEFYEGVTIRIREDENEDHEAISVSGRVTERI
jgi:hypothetical protein